MLTFLHVEDNQDDANLFAIAVQYACVDVLLRRVLHGQHAIDYLEGDGVFADRVQYPFADLVVLDWRLPILDGAAFLRWRAASRFASLPVVILTGVEELLDSEVPRRLRAAKAFAKPLAFTELTEVAAQICDLAAQQQQLVPL